MVNPKCLSNLVPNNRFLGKQRINLTLKPETIEFLKQNYHSVSEGIDQLVSGYAPESTVHWYKSRLENTTKDRDQLLIRIANLQNDVLEARENNVNTQLDKRCWELEKTNTYLEERIRQKTFEVDNLKLENQQLKEQLKTLKFKLENRKQHDQERLTAMVRHGEFILKFNREHGYFLIVPKHLKNPLIDYIEAHDLDYHYYGFDYPLTNHQNIRIDAINTIEGLIELIDKFEKKSDYAYNQISEKNNEIKESDLSLDSHDEKYISVRHDYCDFIEYERVSELVNGEAKLSESDLIIATIYSPIKKTLIEVRKKLDLVLTRYEGIIGKVEENLDGDKQKKWLLQFKCYDVKMSFFCLDKIKQELSS